MKACYVCYTRRTDYFTCLGNRARLCSKCEDKFKRRDYKPAWSLAVPFSVWRKPRR